MSVIATALKHMLAAGMDADAIVAAVTEMEACAPTLDEQAERRRSKDRERKARLRNSAETAEAADTLPETKVSPTPPSKTQTILTPSPPKGGSVPMLSSFPAFWLAYPRKEAKGAAEKAYAKALALIGGPDPPAVLLAALERDKVRWTDAQFIPHPSTWLNQRRWEDEPEPGNGTQRPRTDRRSADYADRMLVVGTALAAAVEQSSRRS